MRLGVVGCGIVGNAFYEGMKHAFEIYRYDKFNKERSDVGSIDELVAQVYGPIFICVPTPMNADGSCNTSIVKDVVKSISNAALKNATYKRRILVVKSTIPPGTIDELNLEYSYVDKKPEELTIIPMVDLVFNPEFLTEASPVEDFKNQDRIILGGSVESVSVVSGVYDKAYPGILQVKCSAKEAEMVKYVANCFLATKVSFANEIYKICQASDLNYNSVLEIAKLDIRLGNSHWKVPGPDGHLGFGGKCFCKDINALMYYAKSMGVDPVLMEAAWKQNLQIRPEKDWEKISGVVSDA